MRSEDSPTRLQRRGGTYDHGPARDPDRDLDGRSALDPGARARARLLVGPDVGRGARLVRASRRGAGLLRRLDLGDDACGDLGEQPGAMRRLPKPCPDVTRAMQAHSQIRPPSARLNPAPITD